MRAGDAVKTAALVLAAGASSRLGEPKQLVRLGGETLLDRAVRVAGEAELEPVVVVLGAHARSITEVCDLRRAWVVVNPGWAEGMGSSVRLGMELVQGFGEIRGAVVMTCDMPAITPEHLSALQGRDGSVTVASAYPDDADGDSARRSDREAGAHEGVQREGTEVRGRRGVPAYFPRAAFFSLLTLRGDAGAREMLRDAETIPLAAGEELDVDTPADLARLAAPRRDGQG